MEKKIKNNFFIKRAYFEEKFLLVHPIKHIMFWTFNYNKNPLVSRPWELLKIYSFRLPVFDTIVSHDFQIIKLTGHSLQHIKKDNKKITTKMFNYNTMNKRIKMAKYQASKNFIQLRFSSSNVQAINNTITNRDFFLTNYLYFTVKI